VGPPCKEVMTNRSRPCSPIKTTQRLPLLTNAAARLPQQQLPEHRGFWDTHCPGCRFEIIQQTAASRWRQPLHVYYAIARHASLGKACQPKNSNLAVQKVRKGIPKEGIIAPGEQQVPTYDKSGVPHWKSCIASCSTCF
jgi:hypothetical protein